MDAERLKTEALSAIAAASSAVDLDEARVRYLGRKSELALALREVRDRETGMLLNGVRAALEGAVAERRAALERAELDRALTEESVDVTLPGEEFALGLFGIRRAAAAERIRHVLRAFSGEEFRGRDDTAFYVTVSAGVAEFPSDGLDLEDLYRAADEALYRAKAEGRNRVAEASAGSTPALEAG